ncbi:MAG: hypothetical protein P1V97_06305 [Planctomycetota bacterium]|nr:hypothetical protein [Planctomycetota bacterium]
MHASTVFIGFAVLSGLRAIFGRFHLSFGRYRSYFDQLLLRACWLLLSVLFLLSWFTRPHTTAPEFNETDSPILVFLLVCAGLLEFCSLLLYRSRIEGKELLVRTDGFGEVRLSSAEIRLLFSMRSGPQGISNDVWLLAKRPHRPMAKPLILVSQVLLRTADRYPFKYLVLAEVRSKKLADRITLDIAEQVGTSTLDIEISANASVLNPPSDTKDSAPVNPRPQPEPIPQKSEPEESGEADVPLGDEATQARS